jgi:predicted HAD superfamily Cof-like phosphohydrolase
MENQKEKKSVSDLQEQVIEFHKLVGQPLVGSPTIPADERVRLRARLVAEEFFEVMRSLYGHHAGLNVSESTIEAVIRNSPTNVNLVELADGLADLDYVVEGTRLEFGIEGDAIAREVHRRNMQKRKGPVRADGKIEKPPGWTPPDIAGELAMQKEEPEEYGLAGLLELFEPDDRE